jgi:spiro-SPASM protein
MANIAVVNAISAGKAARLPIMEGKSSIERAVAFGAGLPGVEKVVMLALRDFEGVQGAVMDSRGSWSQGDLLSALKAHAVDAGNVFYFFADCPLLDPGVAARMFENHVKYFADYTFADGYPYGLCPEIMTAETVRRLSSMAKASEEQSRETIFDLVKQDINSFDIETELSPRDQRLLRVSLTADTRRNFMLIERLVRRGGRDAATVMDILDAHPEVMRTLPAFFPIQITKRCPQTCAYCPYPMFGGDIMNATGTMPVETFARLAKNIAGFCGDAVIDVSLWGEPALHPEIDVIAEIVLAEPGLKLVIETSGIGWEEKTLSRIARLQRRPIWIVSLDAYDERVYESLRGKGFAQSRKTADALLEMFPDSVHLQAVRMKDNEDDLESFYKTWKEKTRAIIIQKYDHFSGFLPQRKVADLSPLTRSPCWHVKRDMPILMDGTVPVCREDVRSRHALGNAIADGLSEVWRRGEEWYTRHIRGDYPEICASCDEWYTYNF